MLAVAAGVVADFGLQPRVRRRVTPPSARCQPGWGGRWATAEGLGCEDPRISIAVDLRASVISAALVGVSRR
jgi:hypothetical protein